MKKRTLKFNENGKFKILVISDLHEKQANGDKDVQNKTEDSMLLIEAAVKAYTPDLVVFNGDSALDETSVEDLEKTIDTITATLRDYNIPFTAVLGNHEHDSVRPDPENFVKKFSSYDESLMRTDKAGISGYANHYIAIKGKSNKTKYLLFFIDSGESNSNNKAISDYDWVKDDQIEWFEDVCDSFKEKNKGEYVPALVFQHMPVTEIYELLKEANPKERADSIKGYSMFSSKHYVLKDGVTGSLLECPCPPDFNNGEFTSWKNHGVRGAFFGHDHTNDFEGVLDGIRLCQCKGTGFNTYTDGIKTGVKLITIDEENLPEFKTKDCYFSDFGLKSKSAVMPHEKMTTEQKKTAAKVGAGVAAAGAVAGIGAFIAKIFKKKK